MSITRLVALMSRAGLDPAPAEVADALWLARYLSAAPAREPVRPAPAAEPVAPQVPHVPGGTAREATTSEEAPGPDLFDLIVRDRDDTVGPTVPIRVPAATALPGKPALGRALRHLRRGFPDRRRLVVDEERTATRVAEEGIWAPVLRPAVERWWEVSLVVDAAPSMRVWAQLVSELGALLAETGAFRDVRTWSLHSTGPGGPGVLPGTGIRTRGLRPPSELVDPARRRLVLVVSDCADHGWRDGTVGAVLWQWARTAPVVVLQPLPQRMWARTGARPVRGRVRARGRGVANSGLRFAVDQRRPRLPPGAVPVPLLQLEPDWVRPWAALVAGTAVGWVDSAMSLTTASPTTRPVAVEPVAPPSDVRVKTFLAAASPEAFTLACYLAAVPLTLPVMRLVQRVMLPASRPSHLAEVLLGGLLRTVPDDPRRYEFAEGVRAELAGYLARGDLRGLRSALSRFCADRLGLSVREFHAAVSGPTEGADDGPDGVGTRFGHLPSSLLTRLGGRYRELVDLFAAEPPRRDEGLAEAADALAGASGAHVDEAIRLHRRAIALAGAEAPRAAAAGLVRALRVRYATSGDAVDLTEALDLEEQALAAGASSSAGLRADLAELRLARYDRTGRMADLDRAVLLLRSACAHTSPAEEAWSARHAALAVALVTRFDRTADLDDLTAAVDARRRAIHPADESRRWRVLFDLAELLRRRFEVLGAGADLDEAVDVYQDSATRAPDAPALATVLRSLVRSLVARFETSGDEHDLTQAVASAREVALIGDPDGPDHGDDLAALATLQVTWFDRSGDLAALTESVRLSRRVLELTAPHDPARPAHLHRLGRTTQARYHATGDPLDLVESVQAWRDAVEATSTDHADHALSLAGLGRALSAKAGQPGPRLDEAIAAFRRAIALTPPDAPGHPSLALTLAVLRIRSGVTNADAVDIGETAVRAHRRVLGDDHPATLLARVDIAAALLDAGHLAGGERAAAEAAEAAAGALGQEDPVTLAARFRAAIASAGRGHRAAAASELAAVLEVQIRVLGAGHPDTEATRRAWEQVR